MVTWENLGVLRTYVIMFFKQNSTALTKHSIPGYLNGCNVSGLQYCGWILVFLCREFGDWRISPSQIFRKISNFDPVELNDLTFWTPWLSYGKKTDSAQLLSVQGDPSPRGCGRGVLSAMVLQQLQPHVRKMKDTRFF